MKKIIFATTNSGKIAWLRRALDKAGLEAIEIDARKLDIIEPQAETCKEVALSKARQAYALLKEPVLVDDSSFHITALSGFPGVYAKYMAEKLGAEGVVEIMKHKKDRSAHFESVLVYIDNRGKEHFFTETPYQGHIAEKVHEITSKDIWGPLHTIFIPAGSDKVLGNMTDEDRKKFEGPHKKNAYAHFVDWLRSETI